MSDQVRQNGLDLMGLRATAERADADGRRWLWEGGYPQTVLREGDVVLVANTFESPDHPSIFAEYIAIFGPPTVLALLDALQASMERGDMEREARVAANDALGDAMEAVQAFVDGEGPRGMALLPIIAKATNAADLRDAIESSSRGRSEDSERL